MLAEPDFFVTSLDKNVTIPYNTDMTNEATITIKNAFNGEVHLGRKVDHPTEARATVLCRGGLIRGLARPGLEVTCSGCRRKAGLPAGPTLAEQSEARMAAFLAHEAEEARLDAEWALAHGVSA